MFDASFSRRLFLRTSAAALACAALPELSFPSASMLQHAIPKTGERIPAIGMGTWQTFDVSSANEKAQITEVLRLFVEHGGSVVDSSPMYGASEEVVGESAARVGAAGKLFFATKVWTSGRDAGIRQMEDSLRKLRASKLDLMQVHNLVDADTHLATLRDWKKQGRVRYLGLTHYTESALPALERAMRAANVDFVQFNYSLAERGAEERMLRAAADTGTAVIINRPFAGSALFSRVRGKPLPDFAAEFGIKSWAQYFLKFIVSHPAVTCAIPATSDPKHLVDNMAAGSGPLPDEQTRRRMADAFERL
jgi:diketogulonate reductase-like aldo/keto reductase